MVTMQQLEELENRVIKALHLIGELRTENSKLENENESLKGEVEDVKLTLEEKEQEIDKVRRELDLATKELKDLKDKEDTLEKKIISLLGKLDGLQVGGIPVDLYADKSSPSRSDIDFHEPSSVRSEEKDLIIESDNENVVVEDKIDAGKDDDDLKVETVQPAPSAVKDEDDEIIIIDDEDEISPKADRKAAAEAAEISHDEDEIILLDDEDEIVIEDVHDDEIIINDEDFEMPDEPEKADRVKAQSADDDEIIIIEDDDVK